MTKKNLEYNKRCAEFLGAEIIDTNQRICIDKMKDSEFIFHNASVDLGTYGYDSKGKNIHYIPFDMLQFHSDWNWIMEVVEVIEKLGLNNIIAYFVKIEAHCSKIYNFNYSVNAKNGICFEFYGKRKETICKAINKFLEWYFTEGLKKDQEILECYKNKQNEPNRTKQRTKRQVTGNV